MDFRKTADAFSTLLEGIAKILILVCGIGLIYIHGWTVVIAYNETGLIGAFLTLSFIVVSDLYWLWDQWYVNPDYVNFYIYWFLASLSITVLGFLVYYIRKTSRK